MTISDNKKLKIFIARNTDWSADWLSDKFEITRDFDGADAILFTGSTYDLDPVVNELHNGIKVNKGAYCYTNSTEDEMEFAIAQRALKAGKMMIGVEKGAHLLTVLSGGQVIQYIDHPCKHPIETYDGSIFTVPSHHHQLMKPFTLPTYKYYVIAWANGLSSAYLNGDNTTVFMRTTHTTNKEIEPEIVYYPTTKCLCFQYDPNDMNYDKSGRVVAEGLVNLLIQNKLYGVMALNISLYDALDENFEFNDHQQLVIKQLKLNRAIENEEQLVN